MSPASDSRFEPSCTTRDPPLIGQERRRRRGLQDALEQGLTRAIGVSNYVASDLDQVLAVGGVPPALNQCQMCAPLSAGIECVARGDSNFSRLGLHRRLGVDPEGIHSQPVDQRCPVLGMAGRSARTTMQPSPTAARIISRTRPTHLCAMSISPTRSSRPWRRRTARAQRRCDTRISRWRLHLVAHGP